MQGDLEGLFVGVTVDESADTALEQLLSLLAGVPGEVQLLLQNSANLAAVELINLLEGRDAVDELEFFPIAVHELLLVEAQVPQVALQLPELVLVGVVEAEPRVLPLHHRQLQHTRLVHLLQLAQEPSIQLQVDPPPDLVLQSEFGVDVFQRDLFVACLPVALVVAVERDVVDAILLALGQLPVLVGKLNMRVVAQLLDGVGVGALLPFLLAIARHVKPADEALLQISRQLLQPLILHLPHLRLVALAVLLDLDKPLAHVGAVGTDEVDAAGSEGRDDDVDLVVAAHVGQVAHEVSKLAAGLGLFEAELAEPSAEHANGVVDVGMHRLYVVDQLVPLLSVHDLADASAHIFLLVDLCDSEGGDAGLLVAIAELVVVEVEVVQVLDEEERPLVEVALLQKQLLPRLFLPYRPVHARDLLVLLRLQIQLGEVVGELAVLGLHDAEPAEVEAAEGGLLGVLVLVQVVEQLGDAVFPLQLQDGVLGRKILSGLAKRLHHNKRICTNIKEKDHLPRYHCQGSANTSLQNHLIITVEDAASPSPLWISQALNCNRTWSRKLSIILLMHIAGRERLPA